jgi:hypothetical protein
MSRCVSSLTEIFRIIPCSLSYRDRFGSITGYLVLFHTVPWHIVIPLKSRLFFSPDWLFSLVELTYLLHAACSKISSFLWEVTCRSTLKIGSIRLFDLILQFQRIFILGWAPTSQTTWFNNQKTIIYIFHGCENLAIYTSTDMFLVLFPFTQVYY